jgi:hypothetical protein
MNERVVYEHETESKLKKLDSEIKGLKNSAKVLEAKAKREYYYKIEKLLEKKQKVEEDYRKMVSAGNEVWIDIKMGIDNAFKEIEHGFNSAKETLEEIKNE